jgi:hypothetical protein
VHRFISEKATDLESATVNQDRTPALPHSEGLELGVDRQLRDCMALQWKNVAYLNGLPKPPPSGTVQTFPAFAAAQLAVTIGALIKYH